MQTYIPIGRKALFLAALALTSLITLPSFISSTTSSSKISTILKGGDDDIYFNVEVQPTFPGGQQALVNFINKNLRYPERARERGTMGRVTISFVVWKNGSISDVRVIKPGKDGLSEEAVRLVKKMPKWTPAKHHGKVVNAKYFLPIDFKFARLS